MQKVACHAGKCIKNGRAWRRRAQLEVLYAAGGHTVLEGEFEDGCHGAVSPVASSTTSLSSSSSQPVGVDLDQSHPPLPDESGQLVPESMSQGRLPGPRRPIEQDQTVQGCRGERQFTAEGERQERSSQKPILDVGIRNDRPPEVLRRRQRAPLDGCDALLHLHRGEPLSCRGPMIRFGCINPVELTGHHHVTGLASAGQPLYFTKLVILWSGTSITE
jgi:hypothetical protein